MRSEPFDGPGAALTGIETGRLLRHPAFLLFGALTVTMYVIASIELRSDDVGQLYNVAANGPPFWVPAAVGVAITAGLAATRSRRDGVDELLSTTPVTTATRLGAHHASLAALAIASGLAVVLFVTFAGGWDGFSFYLEPERTVWVDYPIGSDLDATDVTPSAFELATGPTGLLVWGLFGVAVARRLGSRILVLVAPVLGVIQLIFVTWGPATGARWFFPFTHSAQAVGWVDVAEDGGGLTVARGFNVAATGWHLLYLAGIAVLLIVASAWTRPKARTWAAVGAIGVVLAATGGFAQLATYTADLHSA